MSHTTIAGFVASVTGGTDSAAVAAPAPRPADDPRPTRALPFTPVTVRAADALACAIVAERKATALSATTHGAAWGNRSASERKALRKALATTIRAEYKTLTGRVAGAPTAGAPWHMATDRLAREIGTVDVDLALYIAATEALAVAGIL